MATSAEIKSYIEGLTSSIPDEAERAKAIYEAAKANGVSSSQIDSAMGWNGGTTSSYISNNMSGYSDLGGSAVGTATSETKTSTANTTSTWNNTIPDNGGNCPEGYGFTPWGCAMSSDSSTPPPVVESSMPPPVVESSMPQPLVELKNFVIDATNDIEDEIERARYIHDHLTANNMSYDQLDTAMGWPSGTTIGYIQANIPDVLGGGGNTSIGTPERYIRDSSGDVYRYIPGSGNGQNTPNAQTIGNPNTSDGGYVGQITTNPKPTNWTDPGPGTPGVPGDHYRAYLTNVVGAPGASMPNEAWQTYTAQTIGQDEYLTDKDPITGKPIGNNAVGYSQSAIPPSEIKDYLHQVTAGVSDDDTRNRIIYDKAREFGITADQIDNAMGWPTGSADSVIKGYGWEPLKQGLTAASGAGGYEAQKAEIAQMLGIKPSQVTQEMLVNPNINVQLREGSVAQFEKEDLDRRATIQYQLENLLDFPPGETPAWAKGAIDTMNSELAARGVGRSTIARDSLYNAIVASALPIAQNDANAYKDAWVVNMELDTKVAIANAATLASVSIKDADLFQQGQIANARAFLEMDFKNMDNEMMKQQVNLQAKQQTLLSNQAAINAARKFGSEQEQDIIKFNQQMEATIKMDNAARADKTAEFNATQDFNRQQFNTAMQLEIEKANVEWRRTVNTQNTAGTNAINQANAMNSFELSQKALDYLWNEYRDVAEWAHEGAQNDKEVATKLAIAGMDNQTKLQAASITAKGAIDAARIGAESRESVAATQASTSRYNTDAQSDASATNLLYSVGGKIGGLAVDMFTPNDDGETPFSSIMDSISGSDDAVSWIDGGFEYDAAFEGFDDVPFDAISADGIGW